MTGVGILSTGESWYANADAITTNNPEEIISYTYNADGDITSESDFNWRSRPWSRPTTTPTTAPNQLIAVVETIVGGPAVRVGLHVQRRRRVSSVTASIGGSVDSSGELLGRNTGLSGRVWL